MRHVTRLVFLLLVIASIPLLAQHRRVVFFHFDGQPGPPRGFAINNHGEVAGTLGAELPLQEGFIWANGRFREVFQYKTLPSALISLTQVYGINDRGDTVGLFATDVPDESGFFVRDRHGHGTLLPSGEGAGYPSAINDAGTIVGSNGTHGYVLVGGHYTLVAYPGAALTAFTGINRWGTVSGWYSAGFEAPKTGFIYSDGKFQTTFQCVQDGVAQSTEPRAINDWGEIAGNCGTRMFVRDRFGTITFVNLENVPTQPTMTGINDRGDLVGYSRSSPGDVDTFVMYGAVKRH